ncbi:MAG: DUF456 family protein [Acidobacteriota bacterium]
MVLKIIGYIFFYLFLLGGLASIIFALPGTAIIAGVAFIYALLTHFDKLGLNPLLIVALIAVVAELLEFFAGAIGASKFGATRLGMLGAVLGGISGAILLAPLFFGLGALLGAVVGAFSGAFLLEYLSGKKPLAALQAGVGSMLGRVAAIVIKSLLGVIQIGIITYSLIA